MLAIQCFGIVEGLGGEDPPEALAGVDGVYPAVPCLLGFPVEGVLGGTCITGGEGGCI